MISDRWNKVFTRDNPVRPNVVTAPLNGDWPLDIQRGKERMVLRLRPQAAPVGMRQSRGE